MIEELAKNLYLYVSSFNNFLIALFIFILVIVVSNLFDRHVLRNVSTKRHKSNLGIFIHSVKYGTVVILIIFLIRSYANPNADYSVVLGLISAALGFALQKPITGVAAWLIIVLKRPFYIGDRIIVGEVKGDVLDITLSHIVLQEIGGTVTSEDKSGRIIHLPTLVLFEQNIINYTLNDEYILDEVVVLITYESNLEKAEFIIQKSAHQVLEILDTKSTMAPYVRLYFENSGVNILLRYFVPASRRQEVSSDIIRLIHGGFRKEPDVEIAYPHVQIIRPEDAPRNEPLYTNPKKKRSKEKSGKVSKNVGKGVKSSGKNSGRRSAKKKT